MTKKIKSKIFDILFKFLIARPLFNDFKQNMNLITCYLLFLIYFFNIFLNFKRLIESYFFSFDNLNFKSMKRIVIMITIITSFKFWWQSKFVISK